MATSKNYGLPADVLKRARAATSGATLARAFNAEGKRVRDTARRIGFYQSDASRTQKKYLEGGAPAFGKAREDIIAAYAPTYVKAHANDKPARKRTPSKRAPSAVAAPVTVADTSDNE